MPTYAYACHGCPHTFDARQRIIEDPLRECPSCGKGLLYRRVTGGAAVQFKGSGFYETDYKRTAAKKAEGE